MVTVERSRADAGTAVRIADLINDAFKVEAAFVDGDRTSGNEVLALLSSPSNVFYLAHDGTALVGCIYAEPVAVDRGYIGLLAVEPSFQGGGIGQRLLAHAEDYLRHLGCAVAEITVVDQRTDLFPYYVARGYQRTGAVLPFPRESKQPCALVVMAKPLVDTQAP